MALPPKGDPTRPAHLAARSTRVLGILLTLLGALAVLAVSGDIRYMLRGGRGMWYALIPAAMALGLLGFGIAMLAIVRAIRRMSVWAVITGMVMTSCCLAFSLFYLGVFAWLLIWRSPPPGVYPRALIPLGVLVFSLVAFGQMLMHLIQAFKHRKSDPNYLRGFAPLMAQPVTLASSDSPQIPVAPSQKDTENP